MINASSSAFGGSSVQGFNTDFLVDTGQGYSRHNSYHTGGSNHQFLVNATGSTTNTVALAITKDANSRFNGNVGIGMDAVQALDIDKTSGLSLRFYQSGSFKAGLQAVTTGGQMVATSAANDFALRSQSNMLFSTGGNTERMRIGSSGTVEVMTSGVNFKAPLIQPTNADVSSYTGTTPSMHSPASATMAFSMGGAERMRIKAGKVSIGTTAVGSATSASLHVADPSVDVQAVFGDNLASIDDPQIRIIGRDTANSAIRYLFTGLDADDNHGFIGYNAGAGAFVNALNFNTSGQVGIGTDNPNNSKLHVVST